MTPLSEKSWQISQSRDSLDWDSLRLQSLEPGGFASERAYIWYVFSEMICHPLIFYFFFEANYTTRSHEYPGNTRG